MIHDPRGLPPVRHVVKRTPHNPSILSKIVAAGGEAELRAIWSSLKFSTAVLIALLLEHYFDAIAAAIKGALA